MVVRFVLNDSPVELGSSVDPQLSLLSWLRGQGLTGSKEGCAEGECGACAVALIEEEQAGARYRAVNGCLIPVAALAGKRVVSVEGVANGGLHPVQEAMARAGGSQCGYCTPGFVVSMFCEYHRPGREGACEPECITGNLCRCTGYRPILDALASLPPGPAGDSRLDAARIDEKAARVEHAGQGGRFIRPASLSELLALYDANPEATLLAGGTDLMVEANLRDRRFPLLLSLCALDELCGVELSEGELSLGAGVPLAAIEERTRALAETRPELRALATLWPLFASPLIRNRATLGGNLGTASPIGDSAPVLLALDAELTLLSARGERRVRLSEFFIGYRKTARKTGELIARVHIPLSGQGISRFYKVSKRASDDISAISAAFYLSLDAGGDVREIRAAYGGIAERPLRAFAVEDALRGRPWTRASVEAAKAVASTLGTPIDDSRASARYRGAMLGSLLDKFYADTRATGGLRCLP